MHRTSKALRPGGRWQRSQCFPVSPPCFWSLPLPPSIAVQSQLVKNSQLILLRPTMKFTRLPSRVSSLLSKTTNELRLRPNYRNKNNLHPSKKSNKNIKNKEIAARRRVLSACRHSCATRRSSFCHAAPASIPMLLKAMPNRALMLQDTFSMLAAYSNGPNVEVTSALCARVI